MRPTKHFPFVLALLAGLFPAGWAPAQGLDATGLISRPVDERPAGPLDLLLHSTADRDFLGPRQAALRAKLLRMGVDPLQGRRRPDLGTLFAARLADEAGLAVGEDARLVELFEFEPLQGQMLRVRYPEHLAFLAPADTNALGLAFERPRPYGAPGVRIEVDRPNAWLRGWSAGPLEEAWRQQLEQRRLASDQQRELLNFTIPIKLPRTLERLIGKGEATNIRISGQERISISGESSVSNNFLANEVQQSQSLFPTLEMRQSLRVSLDGTVGEKIKVRVTHDSEAIGSQATDVRLSFEGDEDDIVQVIRAGNIDVTLPGSRLIGVGSSKGGLFGIKVEGTIGALDYTVVTSKEQSQENKKSFNQSGGTEEEFFIPATDYIRGRFFRILAPFPLYLVDEDVRDGSAVLDANGWRIDFESIRLYRSLQNFTPGIPGDDRVILDYGFAAIDSSGQGWSRAEAEALQASDGEYQRYWELLEPPLNLSDPGDYTLLYEGSGGDRPVGLVLSRALGEREALGIAYDIVDASGTVVAQVGITPDGGEDPIPNPSTAEEGVDEVWLLKMLRASQVEAPLDNGMPTRFALTWEYELRNYYDLKGRGIDPNLIELEIRVANSALTNPDLDTRQDPPIPWFQALGLDRQDNQTLELGSDGIPDFSDASLFRLEEGYMQFPLIKPFDPPQAALEEFTGIPGYDLPDTNDETYSTLRMPQLYRQRLTNNTERAQINRFDIVVRHSSTSSRLSLNAFNIKEGSEEVRLDGRLLARGTEYTIDYFSGEINLIDQPLNAQSNIDVKYEVDPLFGGGRTSLHGFNLGYTFGPRKTMSSTWLMQSQPNNATKPRLGEEPRRDIVGNVGAKLQYRPAFLNSLSNLLPLVDTDNEGELRIDAEVAVSIPNPNTKGPGYIEDFESVDESVNISLTREGWWWASLPAEVDSSTGERFHRPADRAWASWHRPVPGVLRGDLNPTLTDTEQRDVLPSLELVVESADSNWGEREFAGIQRSLGGDVDLSRTQFLEFWVNDFTGDVDPASREGTLHFDFGILNEDFYWKYDAQADSFALGRRDTEDTGPNFDGILTLEEDTGLDGIPDELEEGDPVYPQRPGVAGDPLGDNFNASPGDANLFPYINGTEKNQRLDSEDINRDSSLELRDGYFTLSLDLSDTSQALVDIYRDFTGREGYLAEQRARGNAWRKYRVDLRALGQRVAPGGNIEVGRDLPGGATIDSPYTTAVPDLSQVRYLRIWYENPDGTNQRKQRRLIFSEMRFLGNRWVADGLREADQSIIPPAQRGEEDVRVGVLNNKENPTYIPPIDVERRNSVLEKEQSLQFSYNELGEGHEFRTYRDVPGRQGVDLTTYGQLNFFWRMPYEGDRRAPEQDASLVGFYWVGSDSNNYYEIAVPFGEVVPEANDWQEVSLDIGEMTTVKLDTTVVMVDRPFGQIEARRGVVPDAKSFARDGDRYTVTVVGRPDIRRIRRFYAGVRHLGSSAPGPPPPGMPITGNVLFNEIRLEEVDRTVGYAYRAAVNLNLPGVGDLGLEFNRTDPYFRGLGQTTASRTERTDMSARLSSRLEAFVPTLGWEVPFSMNLRQSETTPQFRPSSDILLIDPTLQDEFSSTEFSESYSYQLRRAKGGAKGEGRPWTSWNIDRMSWSQSLARTERRSPASDLSRWSNSMKLNYDLRISGEYNLGLPLTRMKLRYLPNQLTASATLNEDDQLSDSYTLDDFGPRPEDPTRTQRTRSKTLLSSLSLVWNPTRTITGNWSTSINQNMLRTGSDDDVDIIWGQNLGATETRGQRITLGWKPQHRWLQWLKPDVDYTGSYAENMRPGIRQREGDGYKGQKGIVRNISNKGDLTVRGQFNPFGWLQERLKRMKQEREAEAERAAQAWREAQRLAEQEASQAAAGDSLATAAADSAGAPDLEDMAALAREQQEAQREAARRARGEDGGEAAADEDGDGEIEGPGFDPLYPLKEFVINLQPINGSFSRQNDVNYTHVNESADLLFQLGFDQNPGVTELVSPGDDRPYSSYQWSKSDRYSLSTQSQFSKDVRVDLSYSETQRERIGANNRSRDYTVDWPNATVKVSGVHEWPLFGNWFSSSSLDLSYRQSKSATGVTIFAENPRRQRQISPRWNFRFENGLDANLNMTLQQDQQSSSSSLTERTRFQTSLQLQKNFDAEGALSFLRFGQRGTGTTIDMTVRVSYDRNSSQRTLRNSPTEPSEQGNSRLSLQPSFSYQFSRNLRAGLNLSYGRSSDTNLKIVTQSFGLGLDATLTF